jgi:hypothetical protein
MLMENSFSNERPSNDLIIDHMATLQGIITRFATNSANCKTMCLTLIAAILALLAANKEPQTLKIAYSVLILMTWMDAYYLSMERTAVDLSKASSLKIQTGTFTNADLYKIAIGGKGLKAFLIAFKAFFSHSIWPFYGVLLACVLVIQWYFAHIST